MVSMQKNEKRTQDRGRWSSPRKTEVVLRVLKGEDLDALSRELKVSVAKIAEWRDQFLAGGQASLRSRESDDRDEEIGRLRAKVGELTMDKELLNYRIDQIEGSSSRPQQRRSKR